MGIVLYAARNHLRKKATELICKIYSFYGFPSHYYKEKFPHKGSKDIATQVTHVLQSAGIQVKPVSRGLDHGIWTSFKVGECHKQSCSSFENRYCLGRPRTN